VVSSPLKNMKVNGKDYPIYHGKYFFFETTNQLSIVTIVCLSTWCNGILHHLHLCSLCVVPHSFACGYTDVFFYQIQASNAQRTGHRTANWLGSSSLLAIFTRYQRYHFTVLCQALRRAKGPSHTKPSLHFFCTS